MRNAVVLGLGALFLGFTFGCNRDQIKQMDEKIQGLERRVAEIEKRTTRRGATTPPVQTAAYDLPIGTSPVLGDKNAPVTVTVFSDFQCPFCGQADPFLRDLVKDADLKNKVKVVFKHYPLSFHPNARPAAKVALAAAEQGSDKFWAISEKMFQNQRQLSPENYVVWAKDVGLNVTKFNNDLKNNDAKYEDIIKGDMNLGNNTAHVRGTPAIYVGGWELRERSVAGVKSIIQEKKLGS